MVDKLPTVSTGERRISEPSTSYLPTSQVDSKLPSVAQERLEVNRLPDPKLSVEICSVPPEPWRKAKRETGKGPNAQQNGGVFGGKK